MSNPKCAHLDPTKVYQAGAYAGAEVLCLWCPSCGALKVGKGPWRTPSERLAWTKDRDRVRTLECKLATVRKDAP